MKAVLLALVVHLGNWVIAGAAVIAFSAVCAAFDGPTETDTAAVVALDLNDAITAARAATKEQP